ncbi:MAG: glycoside hydrolase family 3 C-terminal domain-containing protein [Bacteroidales bacterium]|nr:glycoside hydrolase family 3 C-terminal domain-containing protein [Bacteroidales bacterium]
MKRTLFAICAFLCTFPMFAQPQLRQDNIDEVLKAMTLEEKALLSVGRGRGISLGGITVSMEVLVPGAAGVTNAIPRLGIPATALPDGPAGIRINPTREGTTQTYYGTGFPVGTAIASSWDVDLVQQMTAAMGNEVLEYGADVLLAPGMNLHRNPLCGRNFEYFSEDPVVTGKIAAAYVKGIQSNGVGVSIKHFAANSQELNRNENDAIVGTRALRELYLKGFEIAVKDADPWTVMSSYNKLNGEYTQQSYDLLTKILRNDWGFKGIVMTDWGSKAGTVKAVHAGNDLMMPGSENEKQRIIDAVNDGSLDIADLDRNVRRILEYIVKTPHFRNYKYSDKPDLKAHAKVARAAATESMVLLKNDNDVLPMKDVKKIALFGVSSVDFVAGGTGSGNVNKAYVVSLTEGFENAGFELDKTLKNYYEKYVEFDKAANGTAGGLLGNRKVPEAALTRAYVDARVAQNDMAVVVIGRNSGEGADRRVDSDFNLSAAESQLINDVCNAFHLAGKKVVVVLNIGGVIETNSWKYLPDGILLAWQPGQEGGDAVADVLTGKVNPSGKLPMTFSNTYMEIPSSMNFPKGDEQNMRNNRGWGAATPAKVKNLDYTEYTEDIWVGYRYFVTKNKAVSFPFGFGLSYTEFAYSKPVVKAANGGFTASVTVTNTGKVAGKEVVEVFVAAPAGNLEKPARELKAFAKTKLLAPGESQTLTFNVSAYELASFNQDKNIWETAAGEYVVYFAKNALCTSTNAKVNLKAATFAVSDAYVK